MLVTSRDRRRFVINSGSAPQPPDIDWTFQGIHPDATDFDTAENYADTTALLNNIAVSVGGTGTDDPLYTDGVNGDQASITTVEGTKVIAYAQDGPITPELWAALNGAYPSMWVRCQTLFPVGWTRNSDGYKLYGHAYSGNNGRCSIEFNSQNLYTVMNHGDDPANEWGYTPDVVFNNSIADPVEDAFFSDLYLCYYKISEYIRMVAVWQAALGDEPVLLCTQYELVRDPDHPIPDFTSFLWGLNMNTGPAEAQFLYHRSWQIVPYAVNSDPWKLLQLAGVSDPTELRIANQLVITGVSGTLSRATGTATLTLTGDNFLMGGNSVYMNQYAGFNVAIDSKNIVNDTNMTVDVSCDPDQPLGPTPLILSVDFLGYDPPAQSYPVFFEVVE